MEKVSLMLIFILASNFLNLLFNVLLGRVLTFEDFSILALYNSIYAIWGIIFAALSLTVNHRVAFLNSHSSLKTAWAFSGRLQRLVFFSGLVLSVSWLALSGPITDFFRIPTVTPIIMFLPILILGGLMSVQKGTLMGNLHFGLVGLIIFAESLLKFSLVLLLIFAGLNAESYLAIPAAVIGTGLLSYLLFARLLRRNKIPDQTPAKFKFPLKLFGVSLLSGITVSLFLTLDVVLVRHFLDAQTAGVYALLSLIGKMIFFFGSLLNGFMVTFISREDGLKEKYKNKIKVSSTFYRFFALSIFLVICAYLGLNLGGKFFLPLLFGEKMTAVFPYLGQYLLTISLFTVANTLVTYHLVRKQFLYPLLSLINVLFMLAGISFRHDSISVIVNVLFNVSLLNLGILLLAHLLSRNLKYIVSFLRDLVDILSDTSELLPVKNKKRILIFNWRDIRHKYAGGAEVYIHELAKRFVSKGHQVTVFCGNDSQSARNESVDGIWIIRRGGFYTVYLWAFLYYLFHFRGKFDVVVDCQNGIPFFTPLFVKEKIYCMMFHVHQKVFLRSLIKPLSVLASFIEAQIMPWVYQDISFVTISKTSKNEMLNLGLGKFGIEVVTPGADFNILKPGLKSSRPTVLYLGRLKYYKSINVFIRSAQKVLSSLPDVQFIIAGEGEEKDGLKKLTQKLNLDENIKFLGKVSEKKKINLLQKAWLVVNPSLMEGWSITAIEANACGTPVIASDVPGLRDSVSNPHSGYLVPYGDIDKFSYNITKLLTNNRLLNRMSKGALKWSKNFNWDNSSQKLLSILM